MPENQFFGSHLILGKCKPAFKQPGRAGIAAGSEPRD